MVAPGNPWAQTEPLPDMSGRGSAPGGHRRRPEFRVGLVLAVLAGCLVLLLAGLILWRYVLRGDPGDAPIAQPSPTSDASEPSASPSSKDPAILDREDLDPTPLTTRAIFPDTSFTGHDDVRYTLSGTVTNRDCQGVGGDKVMKLLQKYGCDQVLVGVFLNSGEDLFSAVLVIPFETKAKAKAAHHDLAKDKQDMINRLTYYCPSTGKPGAELCKRGGDELPTWYGSFHPFHRYLFVAISLYTDGHHATDTSDVDKMTSEVIGYVTDTMLKRD